jgi:DNA-binding NtrC family response regulator
LANGSDPRPADAEPTERLEDRHHRVPGLELLALVEGRTLTFPLPAEGERVVGRSGDADVRLDHPSVSRRHARIRTRGLRVEVLDLGSANGVLLEGERLEAGVWGELSIGRAAELGEAMVLVRPGRPPRPEAATARPAEPLVVGRALEPVLETLRRVADAPVPVLVCGETGVGKQVVAEALHRMSARASGPFVELNAAAVPETLIESELFGHAKGAFTGAEGSRAGLVEQAEGGTLFLDEVGELPLALQAKLLRVLEDRKVTRLGGRGATRVDVRFVAATNRRLEDEVAAGRFRADLLYRLDAIRVEVPPLRQRTDEIPELAARFAEELSEQMGFSLVPAFGEEALRALCAHRWPGNVRELRNVVQRTVLLHRRGRIDVDDLPRSVRAASAPDRPEEAPAPEAPAEAARAAPSRAGGEALRREMEELERRRVLEALDACAGNQTRAAKMLGMSRRALIRRIEAYGIPRPRKGREPKG